MLVLARRVGEKIKIGDDIELVITDIKNDIVRIGIVAPREVPVFRSEVYEKIQQSNREAVEGLKLITDLQNILNGISANKV